MLGLEAGPVAPDRMTSLERMQAALAGEPLDRYPVVNVSPLWSLLPHWPELIGLNFLHRVYGSDAEKIRFYQALHEVLGLDWVPCDGGVGYHDRGRHRVTDEAGVPVLIDTVARSRTRYRELPKDLPPHEPLFDSARDVERLPPPPTAEELLATGVYDFVHILVERLGETLFLWLPSGASFPHCFYMLGPERLFDAMITEPNLIFALLERHDEELRQRARLAKLLGLRAMVVQEFFCSADLISNAHYLRFAFPSEQVAVDAVREQGLVAGMSVMGWIEPRLRHLARLELDCIQVECEMKGRRNDLALVRQSLGESTCLFRNADAVRVIERGDEQTWHRDALEQAKAVGRQHRYAIGSGTPITWATHPSRFRRFAEYTGRVLAEAVSPT